MVTVAAHAGLRVGEIAGLRANRIHTAASFLSVDAQAAWNSKDQTSHWIPTKSGHPRTVPMSTHLASTLAAHIASSGVTGADSMFTTATGKQWTTSNAARVLRLFVAAHKLDASTLHFHSFRHLYASTLLGQRMSLPEVSKLLGHSSILTTASVYAHVIAGSETRSASIIDAAFTPITSSEE